jgi:hypothetical protein
MELRDSRETRWLLASIDETRAGDGRVCECFRSRAQDARRLVTLHRWEEGRESRTTSGEKIVRGAGGGGKDEAISSHGKIRRLGEGIEG